MLGCLGGPGVQEARIAPETTLPLRCGSWPPACQGYRKRTPAGGGGEITRELAAIDKGGNRGRWGLTIPLEMLCLPGRMGQWPPNFGAVL